MTPTRVLACETLTGPDLKAFNTFEQPRRVAPQRLEPPAGGAADDVQAASAFVYGGPARDDVTILKLVEDNGRPNKPLQPTCRSCKSWPFELTESAARG